MATVLDPKPAKTDARLEDALGKAASRIRLNDVLAGGVGLVVLTLAYAVVSILADRMFDLPLWSRQLGLAGFVAALAGLGYFIVLRPFRRVVNPRYAARQIEATVPDAKNAVINWVDLRDQELSASIRSAIGVKAADGFADADVHKATESRTLFWLGLAAGLLAAVLLAQLVICKPTQFFSLLRRSFTPFSQTTIATRTQITLTEPTAGDVTVTVGDTFTVAVALGGRVPDPVSPERVRLQFRHNPAATEYDELPLERGATNHEWSIRVPEYAIQNGFWYRVAAGDAATPEYRVDVRSKPLFKGIEVRYEYPAYLRMQPETGKDYRLEAYRGTKVTLMVKTNRPLTTGRMIVAGRSEPVPVRVVGEGRDSLEFQVTLQQSTTYQLGFTSTTGEQSPTTPAYPIEVLVDQPPTVEIIEPKVEANKEVTLPVNGFLKVDGTIGDDFGIDKATLKLRALVGEKNEKAIELKPRPYQEGKSFRREMDGSYPTALEYKDSTALTELVDEAGAPVKLKEGDTLEFWLEASDNCTEPKANIGKSKEVRVKLGPPVVEPMQQQQQKEDAAARKQQEKQHTEKQDQRLNTEKRDPPQGRQDGEQPKSDKPEEGQPNQGQGKPEAGNNPSDAKKPEAGNNPSDAKKPEAGTNPDGSKPETQPQATPEKNGNEPSKDPGQPMPMKNGTEGQPSKTEQQPGGTGSDASQKRSEPVKDTAAEKDLQKKAEEAQKELDRQNQDGGRGRGNEEKPTADEKRDGQPMPGSDQKPGKPEDGSAKPKPEQNPDNKGEAKPRPQEGSSGKPEPASEKPMSGGEQNPASEKPDGSAQGNPMPGGGQPGKPEEKSSNPKDWPQKKPEKGELSRETGRDGTAEPPDEDVPRLMRDREDLASNNEQKRKEAEEKFDDLLGKRTASSFKMM